MNFHYTYFLAFSAEIVDQLFCCFAYRTHGNYDFCGFRISVIVERLIICAYFSIYFVHVLCNDIRCLQVRGVAGLPVLEESLRLFSTSHAVRMVRIKRSVFECPYCIPIYHFLQIIVVPYLNFLVFVGCSESVKEVKHRQFTCYGCQVCHCCQIHYLLNAVGCQHGKSCLAASHYIGVISEN